MSNPFAQFATSNPAAENPFVQFKAPAAPEMPQGVNLDASEDEIREAIKVLPAPLRKKANAEWVKRRVETERKGAGGMYDVARNLARGTPIGSWLDEGVAGAKALAGYGDYDENLALERARNEAADSSATKIGRLPIIGDVTTAGVTKLAGGLASAPFTPMIKAAQGASMLGRMLAAGATGAGYGTVYGAGEGEGVDRAKNAAMGAALGGVAGGVTPPIAQGIGNAVSGIAGMAQRTPTMLRQYDRGAINRVAQGATDDGVIGGANPSYLRQAQELGPEGMLADMGENLRGQAGAIANSPGRGLTRVTQAIEGRRDGATGRITQDMDAALGPAVNVPRTVEALRQKANAQARPFYDRFEAMVINPDMHPQLQPILRRAEVDGIVTEARKSLARKGYDPDAVVNTGLFWDQMKRSADGMAGVAERSGNRELTGQFRSIAKDIRDAVDDIVRVNPSAQSIYKTARDKAGDGLQFEEAAEMGQGAFRKSLTPDQMDMDVSRLNPLQTEAYRVGARDAARTNMGNAGTAFGANGDTAARKLLQTEFGAEKMRRIAPNPADADRLSGRLKTETTFAETEQAVLRNSATARRQAAQKQFPGPVNSSEVGARLGQKTLWGAAVEGTYRLGNLLTRGAIDAKRARIADHAAEMLMAQGVPRDAIVQGLRQYAARQRLSGERAAAISRFIESIERGVAPAQVGEGKPLEITVYPSGDPRNGQ